MAIETRVKTVTNFPGLTTNVDAQDVGDGGTSEQVNATCVVAGELRVRGGMRQVDWGE